MHHLTMRTELCSLLVPPHHGAFFLTDIEETILLQQHITTLQQIIRNLNCLPQDVRDGYISRQSRSTLYNERSVSIIRNKLTKY